MPRISVICPVYNGEKTLGRCLQSLCAQTFSDWECIVIDDGSTDGSPALLRALTDARFRVLTIPNGGVSRARNLGLDQAQGEAITFLDCDDWLEPCALETLWSLYAQADMAIAHLVMEDASGMRLPRSPAAHAAPWRPSPEETARAVFRGVPFGGYLHAKLLRRERIGALRFDEDVSIYEDMLFCLRVLAGCERIAYTDRIVHHYVVQDGAMASRMTARKASSLTACDRMLALTERRFPAVSDEARLFSVRNALWLLEELTQSPAAVRRADWAAQARRQALAAIKQPCDKSRLPRVQQLFLRCLRAGYPFYFAVLRGLYGPFARLKRH